MGFNTVSFPNLKVSILLILVSLKCAGFETHTRDTIFSVGLQGISMDSVDQIESTIKTTFENVAETGFDADRIEAILHRTELALKKQVS